MGIKRSIVLIGGGGHCKSVLDSLLNMNKYSDIFITDHSAPIGSEIMGCRVVGTDDVLEELFDKGVKDAFITIGSTGNSSRRKKAFQKAKMLGFSFPTIIDSTAIVSKNANIGQGVFIGKKAVINAGTSIDDITIINTGTIIEHDCSIGSFVHISVGAVVCGECYVGNDSFIGANASIIQCSRIGKGSVIGAGAVVISDIGDYCTAVGIPARVIKEKHCDRY